jgi:RHS repeat-associated protein
MIKGKLNKGIVVFIIFLLVFTSVPINSKAETGGSVLENNEVRDIQENTNTKEDNEKNQLNKEEIVEERTDNTKVFDNGDGTFTKNIYFEPIHRKEAEEWEEISPELHTTTVGDEPVIETENTLLESIFNNEMNNGEYATFKKGQESITFSILEAAGNGEKIIANDVKPTFEENRILHKDIFPNIDLRNFTFDQNVKEDIILNSYKGVNSFKFRLGTTLEAQEQVDGSITFHKTGETVPTFTLPKPFMTDSNIDPFSAEAVRSENVKYILERENENGYILTVTADEDWLKDPVRQYPVYIDPTTSLATSSDAFVMSAYPTTNYGTPTQKWDSSQNQYVLKVGYYDGTTGTNYAFLKQDIAKIKNAVIDAATLKVFVTHSYSATTPNGLWLDEVTGSWTETGLTWNNKPSSVNIGKIDVMRDQWGEFNVLNTVKAWAAGTKTNNGFKLHANGNTQAYWKKVVSSDNSTYKPFLSVTYHYNAPPAPTATAYSNGTGSGTGYLNINWTKVPGATGYKVLIYNGKIYEAINVGDVSTWSTKGKKLWPTLAQYENGEYGLRIAKQDGTEFAFNPNPVYQVAALDGGTYASRRNYAIRIVAIYPGGDSPYSGAAVPIMPMETPKTPTGRPYTNAPKENSGYVNLEWAPTTEADGYKILMFNGKAYQEVDDVPASQTTWTTQNKSLWPTEAQISQGLFELNTEEKGTKGNGTELAIDPSPVYNNAASGYQGRTNYWFRIKAYSNAGHPESNDSGAYMPTMPGSDPFLGMEEYWTGIDVENGTVNAATGNLMIKETDVSIDGRGPGLGIDRTYNSKSTAIGMYGKGWHSDSEMRMIALGNEVKFTDEDGTIHRFQKQADNSFKPPTGVYLELQETTSEYVLTSKDQTKIHFDKLNGNLLKIVDGHGNATTYSYSNNKLQTVKDASGRILTLTYNTAGYLSKITDPKNRVTLFEYQGEQLISSTNPKGEQTKYEYDNNGLLIKLYNPTHVTENPVVTNYIYEGTDNRIQTIVDPEEKTTEFAYDIANRSLTVTEPKLNKTYYEYNAAANPTKMIVDSEGLKLTTTYIYEGNNLKETREPKDQGAATATESYQYDNDGNVTGATDSYGTESYAYNQNNDVTSITDTEGDETSIAYDGLNAVSETDLKAKTSTVSKYDGFGNLTQSSDELSSATNEALNTSFESSLAPWVMSAVRDSGTVSIDATDSSPILGGKQSVKVSISSSSPGTEHGYMAAIQDVVVSPDTTYSLSGQIKTDNLKKGMAFFNVQFLNASGTGIGYSDNRYSQLTGTKNWTERQLTFKTPANTAKIRIYLEVDHKANDASGSAWFDQIQLEKNEVSSSYNPFVNSSFEKDLGSWTGVGGSVDTQSFDGIKSLKFSRTSTTQADNQYKQTVVIGQKADDNPVTLTVTGLSKAQTVVNTGGTEPNEDYSIFAKVYLTDGTSKDYYAKFPLGTQEWNRAAVKIAPDQPIDRIEIMPTFRKGNTGTVWYDAIRLLEGNVLSKQTYDSAGNYVVESEDEIGRISNSSYNEVGSLLEEINPKGIKKSFSYDSADRLTELLLSNGTKISYEYNKNGSMTSKSIISAKDNKTQKFSYSNDRNEQLKQVEDPLGNLTNHEYDANGNKIKTNLPNGNIVEWKYDGADRLHQIVRNEAPVFEFGYDANGNETSVKDFSTNSTKQRVYDKSDRVTSITDRGGKIDWTYPTETDKLQSMTITHGATTETNSYTYNELDQNTLVKNGTLTYRFDYDERGNVRTYTAANGSGATFNYDDAGQVTNLSIGTATGETILSERYTYDKNGNRTKIDGSDGSSTAYEYDAFDELTKETLPDGTVLEYQYDGFGNRTKVSKTAGSTLSEFIGEFNLANQLVKFNNETISYDKNGNRTSDNQFEYKWNAADQLVAVTKKGETTPFATYEYDEDGRRIKKVVNSEVTNYIYDGDGLNVLYETNGNNTLVRSYIYSESGELLAMKKGNQTYYYHTNAHGDVIALTNQQGVEVASYSYDSWGNITSEQENDEVKDNPFRYAGYQYNKETGLYYLMARYYQANHGVFLSSDPDPGDDDDTLTQNGFSYANNNPVMFIDPDGNRASIIKGGVKFVWNGGKWVAKKIKKVFKKKNQKISGSMIDSALGKLNDNQRGHIMAEKHAWKKVTSNPRKWKNIKKVMKNVMKNGKESDYGSARQKTKKIKGKTVVVTFVRLKDGTIRISNAWVKTR